MYMLFTHTYKHNNIQCAALYSYSGLRRGLNVNTHFEFRAQLGSYWFYVFIITIIFFVLLLLVSYYVKRY